MNATVKAEKITKGEYSYKGFTIKNIGRDKWMINNSEDVLARSLSAAQEAIDDVIAHQEKVEAETKKAQAIEDEIAQDSVERSRAYQRNRWANRSEDEKSSYREYRKERWNNRTEEEKAKDREYRRQRYHRIKAMTVEE